MATLDPQQQKLINIIKAAHQTLALARKTRSSELGRRLQANELRARQAYEADLQTSADRIRMELDAEIAIHESNLDEALIAAYNNTVPVRRMALEGFGNRYDGGVQQLIAKLRTDGRIGSREGFQRNATDPEDVETAVAFPKAVNMGDLLQESMMLNPPLYTLGDIIELMEPSAPGIDDGLYAQSVILTLDAREPWFKQVKPNLRPGTPYATAVSATLYRHPDGKIHSLESKEPGVTMVDHPVARWALEHPDEVEAGFEAAALYA